MSHGLAATIRGTVESETFDFAGSNAETIENVIRDAFTEPFTLNEMIRLTFITGAGKLGRARYDDNAAKAVTSTLRELGYEEDRAASAVLDCAGTFKLQHDTGKNLKTVVVFPKVNLSQNNGGDSNNIENGIENMKLGNGNSFLQEGSIEYKLAYTTLNVFPRMIDSMCQTWSQKKGCVEALTEIKTKIELLDEKLMQGQPLNDVEQEFYNTVSMNTITEKITCVREQMHKLVDDGKITIYEKDLLLKQVNDKIQTLIEEINIAIKEKKLKRVDNLTNVKDKAIQRKEKLYNINTVKLPPLKNEVAITKLRKEMIPLLQIEDSAKGRLLSLKESQAVAKKDEIIQEIHDLENASRGWFESDDTFNARVKASNDAWQALRKSQQSKKKTTSTGGGGGGTKSSSSLPSTAKWVSTPGPKKSNNAWSKPTKSKVATGGGLFAAMMNDSDSD